MKTQQILILSEDVYTGDIPAGKSPVLVSNDRFQQCVEYIFEYEGGFINDERDRGGATNMGITIGTLSDWRGHKVTVQDVIDLTREEALEIYYKRYWLPCECDVLPVPYDLLVFNFAVNAGNFASQKQVQDALTKMGYNIGPLDGDIGPKTFAALMQVDPHTLVMRLRDEYEAYYRQAPTAHVHLNGWLNRLAKVTKIALAETPAKPVDKIVRASAMENWPREEKAMPNAAQPSSTIPFTIIDMILGKQLTGYKTYIGIAAWVIVNVAASQGIAPDFFTPDTVATLNTGITGWIGVSAISKVERIFNVFFSKKSA